MRSLDLGRDLQLGVAQLVVQALRGLELGPERSDRRVEALAVARPSHVDLVRGVDEEQRRDDEEQAGDPQAVVEPGGADRDGGPGKVPGQGPFVVAAPHRQRPARRAQGDDRGQEPRVDEEVHGSRRERGHHLLEEGGVRRQEGEVEEAAGAGRDHVVGDVERHLHRVAREPGGRGPGHRGHDERLPEAELDQGREDGDERHGHDPDDREPDLAQVGQRGEDDEGGEGEGEGGAIEPGRAHETGGGDHRGGRHRQNDRGLLPRRGGARLLGVTVCGHCPSMSTVQANLVQANFVQANFVQANLVQANLVQANLVQANLVHANLVHAM
jgi:hypothetical protein